MESLRTDELVDRFVAADKKEKRRLWNAIGANIYQFSNRQLEELATADSSDGVPGYYARAFLRVVDERRRGQKISRQTHQTAGVVA